MSVRSVSRKSRISRKVSKILVTGFLSGGALIGEIGVAGEPSVATASPSPAANPITQQVQEIFAHCQSAVVKIEAVDPVDRGTLAGTGFFIDPNGTIYTTYSVGGETKDIVVSYGDKKYPATRLLADRRSGIAILKVEASTPFLPISKAGDLTVATPVLSVGYPMDLPLTPSLGIVAGLDSKSQDGYFLTTHIRANLPVQRGQGGSPLLDLKGEVVGIIVSGLGYGTGCYALPIAAAEKVRMDYVRFGDVHHGWIGINVVQASDGAGGSNVVVNDLLDNTPAAKSGLQKGDLLIQIGDKKISAAPDILNASFFLTAGDEVPITVIRGTEKIIVKVLPIPDVPLNAGASPAPNSGIPLGLQRP